MRQIIRRIKELSEAVFLMEDISITSNPGFLEVLNSYPEYVSQKQHFVECPPEREETRGTKSSVEYSDDVCFLAYLIELLYKSQGRDFRSNDREKVKRLIGNSVSGKADFFDPVRGKMWINVFSALDYNLHLFAPEGTDNFDVFFGNYVSFYGKLNNKKIVPFYARWIKEIAAMYTIYLHETYDEFKLTGALLQAVLKLSVTNKHKRRQLRYETDNVRNYLMQEIFGAYKKDKTTVISKLCAYILENPDEFVYEKGENKGYRRYYCVIKEMLNWLKDRDAFRLDNDKLLKVFCDDNVGYKLKDDNVRTLEAVLAKKLIRLFESNDNKVLSDFENKVLLGFLIAESRMFVGNDKKGNEYSRTNQLTFLPSGFLGEETKDEIVFEVVETKELKKREIERVVDGVVKLLRFTIMLVIISQGQSKAKNEYEKPSKCDVINDINKVMKDFGLLTLPTYEVNSFNDDVLMDFCVVKYIEETFDEED